MSEQSFGSTVKAAETTRGLWFVFAGPKGSAGDGCLYGDERDSPGHD